MPGYFLTTASRIQCPHGGQAILSTSNSKVFANSALVLLEKDVHPIVGCPFTVGTKYSPCVRIEWSAGAGKSKVERTAPLIQSSLGKCLNAEGAPQGIAIIVNTQSKGSTQ